jgi:hypothetical protein
LGQGANSTPGRVGSVSDPNRAVGAWMTPERWVQLEPLVDAALDLAPDQRPAFYETCVVETSRTARGSGTPRWPGRG